MRRHVEILLKFTVTTGHQHPHLPTAMGNYHQLLLQAMNVSDGEIRERLDALLAEYGMSPG
jgi:hypothetical protein